MNPEICITSSKRFCIIEFISPISHAMLYGRMFRKVALETCLLHARLVGDFFSFVTNLESFKEKVHFTLKLICGLGCR